MRWTRYALALDDCTMALPQPNGPLHTHMVRSPPTQRSSRRRSSRMRCHLVGCAHMASLGRLTQMKADTKDLIEFLVGLAWTGVIVWFTATSYQHINELGFVILFTSGAFGWMPLARSEYPRAPGTLGAWLVLECGVRLWNCAAVVSMVREQGFLMSVLGVIMYVGGGWLLIGIGWLVWKGIRRINGERPIINAESISFPMR